LETHLSLLQRQGILGVWYDRKIGAGTEWKGQIDAHLESAELILMLISPDFLASDYCYDVELKRALERHETGLARAIPIILRPVDWHDAPFGKLQALPKDGKPISLWANRDEAFRNVVDGIRRAARDLRTGKPYPLTQKFEVPKPSRPGGGENARPWLDPGAGSSTLLPLREEQRTAPKDASRPRVILLVEDDPDVARHLSQSLGADGYRVTAVDTGIEARSIVEQLQPDLVLLDLMLPDTDGLVLLTALKTLSGAPIIICSVRQQQVDRVLALKLGADDSSQSHSTWMIWKRGWMPCCVGQDDAKPPQTRAEEDAGVATRGSNPTRLNWQQWLRTVQQVCKATHYVLSHVYATQCDTSLV